jgi:hypothetical protein
MKVIPPLSPKEDLALLRMKYPDGLICTSPLPCDHRVIATTRAGYAKSNLTEEQRLGYICCECRQAAAERERVAAVKVEKARTAGAAARAARRRQKLEEGATRPATRSPRMGRLDLREMVDVEDGGFDGHAAPSGRVKGGRPRLHATDTARQTAAKRAYRARRKAVPA